MSMAAEPRSTEEPMEDLNEVSEVIPFTHAITSHGADYQVETNQIQRDRGSSL